MTDQSYTTELRIQKLQVSFGLLADAVTELNHRLHSGVMSRYIAACVEQARRVADPNTEDCER